MRKFSDLEKEGYKGGDASLEISLFEYGLIWKEDEKDITFIYGVQYGDNEYCMFDWSTIEKDVDPLKEWDWIDDWEHVYTFAGLRGILAFLNRPLTCIISDLLSYYGYMNVFGDSYYPFEIEMED